MKKNTLLTTLFIAALGLLTSCGGSVKLDPEVEAIVKDVKNGILGEKGGELIQREAEIEALKLTSKDIKEKMEEKMDEMDKRGDEDFSALKGVGEELGKLQKEVGEACDALDKQGEQLCKELEGYEVATEIADSVPLKLVEPFKVTQSVWNNSEEQMGFMPLRTTGYASFKLTAKIELTEDRPMIHDRIHNPDYYFITLAVIGQDGEPTDTVSAYTNFNSTSNDLNKGTESEIEIWVKTESEFALNRKHNDCRLLTAKALRIIWEHPFQEKIADTVHGDLGIFGLRGPVKEVKWKTLWDTWTIFFNIDGQWTGDRGRNRFGTFPKITRDDMGRIVKMSDSFDEQRMTFQYNADGLNIRETSEFFDGGGETTFEWDEEGFCKKEVNKYSDMDGEDNSVYNYTVLERDEHNNWTRRKNQNGQVETRAITYYE